MNDLSNPIFHDENKAREWLAPTRPLSLGRNVHHELYDLFVCSKNSLPFGEAILSLELAFR